VLTLCDALSPLQDKAIKRFLVRNIVDSGALNDIKAATALEGKRALGADGYCSRASRRDAHVVVLPQATLCPSSTPRSTTASPVLCTPALCACAPLRLAASACTSAVAALVYVSVGWCVLMRRDKDLMCVVCLFRRSTSVTTTRRRAPPRKRFGSVFVLCWSQEQTGFVESKRGG